MHVSFPRESNNQGFSPICLPFSCLQDLLQTKVRTSIMASPPSLTNSAGMLSIPADFPIFKTLTAASTSSRSIGRGSSFGTCICGQSSTVGSSSVS